MKTKKINIGSVSSGTMRPEDLIPDFMWELRHQAPCKREHRALLTEIKSRMEADDYYESEESGWDLESLFDALDDYTPPYFYFGAHPGDGADYGYWLSESFEDDFDGLKVSDTADIPSTYYGEVLVVNDHGNMTLYRRAYNRRLVVLWELV